MHFRDGSILAAVLFCITLGYTLPSLAAGQALVSSLTWHDKALASCVNSTAEKQSWQYVSQVTKLKCHAMGIESGAGLEQLTALNDLSLFNNQLKSLDLSTLKTLESLNLANNQLENLRITGLFKLKTLYLFKNKLVSLDLSGLHAVTKLRAMQNRFIQLNIQPLTALKKAYLFDNKLEDLKIAGLQQLQFLDVKQNPMPDAVYDRFDELEDITIIHDGNADDWK